MRCGTFSRTVFLTAAFFALALLLTLTPSAAQQSAQTAGKADSDYVVKLGYYNCDHMTAAPVAKDAGIFEELGLKVMVTGNGQVPEAMAAGQMDIGYIGFERMVRAHLKGAPIFAAAQNHLGGSSYIVVRKEINDPKELIGKKMAIHKSGSKPETMFPEWVNFATASGIPVEGKNYELFDMADKDQFLALKLGKLDGYLSCDPWGSMAEHDGCGKILFSSTKLPNGKWGTCCVYSMNANFAEQHPELAKKMILAHAKAIQFIYTRPLKTAEIFEKNYSVPLEVALMTIYKKTVAENRTLTWDLKMENIREALEWDLKRNILADGGNPETYVRTELLSKSGVSDFNAFIKEKVDPLFPLSMTYKDWKKKAYEIEGKTLQASAK
ncbi:MAG: ABC transporter substrate-binding protein [Desulfobacteraceae bacterium]|nr:ABC transporter substrate-binding protein [Desulfobacteraceae bacterium]